MSASPGKYVVIETDTDGTVSGLWSVLMGLGLIWRWTRFQELGSGESARSLPLLSSSDLTRDLPDWRRTSAKPPVSG